LSCFSDGHIDDEEEDQEFGEPIIKLRDFTKKSEEKYTSQDPITGTPNYDTVRDNKFFNKFAIKYNKKLMGLFDEADKEASYQLNKSGGGANTSSATLKQDVLAYMEQHSEIRRLMNDEA
jgi:hypothetical protein